jgi:hypothetical protein
MTGKVSPIFWYFQLRILTLILLTWSIGWAPNNASKWQMGFNSVFKRLKITLHQTLLSCMQYGTYLCTVHILYVPYSICIYTILYIGRFLIAYNTAVSGAMWFLLYAVENIKILGKILETAEELIYSPINVDCYTIDGRGNWQHRYIWLQLGSHPVEVVHYTFTHKQYREQHKTNNT